MRRAALILPMLGLSLGTPGPIAAEAAPATPRALVVVVPGAGTTLVNRMLADGVMPHLAKLKRDGLAASVRPGLAAGSLSGRSTLWTGAWGAVHGVTGDRLLYPTGQDHTLLEARPAGASALAAEPLFKAAARAGKPTLAFHVARAEVPAPTSPLAVLQSESGGEDGVWTEAQGLAPARGWEGLPESDQPPLETTYALAGQIYYGLVFGDPADAAVGYDTLWLAEARRLDLPLARLKPGPPMERNAWSAPVRLGAGGEAFFRLFDLARDGKTFRLYHTASQRWATNRPAWLDDLAREPWGHVEAPATAAFLDGRLGRTLAEGGDGTAEARYLDTVRFCLYRRQQVARHLLQQAPWSLAVNELPVPAPAVGMWLGYLTPRSPAHSKTLEATLWPALRQVFVEVDAYLGALRQALPPDAHMVVVSDTGYVPVRWEFMPNIALRRAGLLTVDPDGHVDLTRTRALFPDTGGQYVAVNVVGRPGGTVKPAEVASVVQQARAALAEMNVKTPGGVVPLVRSMYEPTPDLQRTLGLGGSRGGHLYLALQSGYAFSPAVTGEQQFVDRPPNHSAAPATFPEHPDAQGLWVMAGPSIKRGATLSGIRAIDVAPTVARLIGVPAPAQSQGRVVKEALR